MEPIITCTSKVRVQIRHLFTSFRTNTVYRGSCFIGYAAEEKANNQNLTAPVIRGKNTDPCILKMLLQNRIKLIAYKNRETNVRNKNPPKTHERVHLERAQVKILNIYSVQILENNLHLNIWDGLSVLKSPEF